MGTAEGNSLTPLVPFPSSNGNKKCQMCELNSSKYTCPRCQMKTCCLSCVKNHKAQSGCSGVRDKTAFVPIKEFTESHLLSDYRLLEDVDRKRYSANNDVKNKPGYLNGRWKTVSKKAAERGVRLRLLPHYFSKHKENSTNVKKLREFDTKKKRITVIMWHVKWVFPQANAEFTDIRLSEETVLKEALHKYLHPDRADPVVRQRLKKYCSAGIDDIQVYMKVEDRPANTLRYYNISLDNTIRNNLKGKIIVEYPTFHVVLRDHTDQYQLLHQDTRNHFHGGAVDSSPSLKTMEQGREDGEIDEDYQSLKTKEEEKEEGEVKDNACSSKITNQEKEEGEIEDNACSSKITNQEKEEGEEEDSGCSSKIMDQEKEEEEEEEGPPEERSSHQTDDTR